MDRPTAILYSSTPKPGWATISGHSCGGFSCDSLDGWAHLLPLAAGVEQVVKAIAEEKFCEQCANPSMDYFGNPGDYQEQQQAYRQFLDEQGLTVCENHLAKLKQAAYPMDATPENLRRLVGEGSVLSESLDGLMIVVLGDNCD